MAQSSAAPVGVARCCHAGAGGFSVGAVGVVVDDQGVSGGWRVVEGLVMD